MEGVGFIFYIGKSLSKSLKGFKDSFNILFIEDFGSFVYGALEERKIGLRSKGVMRGFNCRVIFFIEFFVDLVEGVVIVFKGIFYVILF